jgi:hypothetical protein
MKEGSSCRESHMKEATANNGHWKGYMKEATARNGYPDANCMTQVA